MTIHLKGITKSFPSVNSGPDIPVLDNFDLDVPDGAIVSVFGPNGCGKTTLLNIIAKIETPDHGQVSINGGDNQRLSVGYVFQNFRDALFPWQTALDNAAFGLRAQGLPSAEAREQAESFLKQHHLDFPRNNYSYQLSIGQQQTVMLSRTLIQSPANVLLDEPFASLDHTARFRMQNLVISLLRASKAATVVVSHDVDECLYLSQELILLSKRPARVLKRFAVPFPYPREHSLLASSEFAALRQDVVAAFLKEVQP